MTGPEHYKVAETLLANLRCVIAGASVPLHTAEQQTRMIAEAQVHATLALTAATAEEVTGDPGPVGREWSEAIS